MPNKVKVLAKRNVVAGKLGRVARAVGNVKLPGGGVGEGDCGDDNWGNPGGDPMPGTQQPRPQKVNVVGAPILSTGARMISGLGRINKLKR